MLKKNLPIMLLFTVMALFSSTFAHACPGCNGALDNSLGFGFNTSILFMMAMPFVVAGAIGFGLIYTYRRSRNNSTFNKNSSSENLQAKEKQN
jgi:hypothetical protein